MLEGLVPNHLSRRGFLQRALAALTAGAGLPAWFAQELIAAEQEKQAKEKKTVAANDRLVLGVIGCGHPNSRGTHIMALAKAHKGVEVAAVCDVDARHRDRAARLAGRDVEKFEDFRKLLDRSDLNAVLIATPDHWHTLIAMEALRKGMDIYCEKPLTLTVAEGQALVKAAKSTDRIFQVGSQQRSEYRGMFRLACELVRNGRLGKIRTIETRIGSNPTSPVVPPVDPPQELNWDFWLGPTPKVPYRFVQMQAGGGLPRRAPGGEVFTNCHYEFRWWYAYSGGKMTDWGAHHNDVAQWALDMDQSGPILVEGSGTRPARVAGQYNCHPDFKAVFTYANGVKVICTSGGENGVQFNGENGKWLFVGRGKITASDKALLDEKLPADAKRLYLATDHMGNFLDCVRSRKPTICPAEVGHRSATVCHIGNISIRLGKKLKWDPVEERFDDDKANAMLRREMRAPWKLEA
jgi:predicted dehydrogenase